MIAIYVIALTISVVNTVIIFSKGRVQNICKILLGVLVVMSNFGYLAIALSQNLETALLANKLTYIGSSALMLLNMSVIAELCNVKLFKVIRVGMAIYSLLTIGLAFTAGYSDIYYKTVELRQAYGISYLEKTYGPAHILYTALVVGSMIVTLTMLLFSLTKKTKVSYRTIIVFGSSLIVCAGIYLLERGLALKLELVPIIYDMIMICITMTFDHIDMYDMSPNVQKVFDAMEEYGYLTFDTHKRFMGCNELARQYFPQLSKAKIDFSLSGAGMDPYDALVDWINEYTSDSTEATRTYSLNSRILRFHIRDLVSNRKTKKIGYILEFYDITREQKYVNMIENFNTNLEREVAVKTADISHVKDMMVLGMASMVESRDNSTGGHIKRSNAVVNIFSDQLLRHQTEFHVSEKFLEQVAKAASMHDLGKITVDDSILRKQGKYTPEEYAQMKLHSSAGAKIVDEILQGVEDDDFIVIARNVAHYHHERWDGKGYPTGLAGCAIPLEARIMALADVFDALVSKRCYKEAFSYDEAFSIIEESLGTHFDPELGKIFCECRDSLEELYDVWKAAV